MTDEITVYYPGDTLTISEGYYAEVVIKQIVVTKDQVLDRLIAMDRHSAKVGDILELQILAKASRDDRRSDIQGTETDPQPVD